MIAEAVDAAITLGWALAAWILALAAICTLGFLGMLALTAWAWTACTRALRRPVWARGRVRARIHARARVRDPYARPRPPLPRHDAQRPHRAPETTSSDSSATEHASRAPQRRTQPSRAHTQPHREEPA